MERNEMARRRIKEKEPPGGDRIGKERLLFLILGVTIVAFITLFYFVSEHGGEAGKVNISEAHMDDPELKALIARFEKSPEDIDAVRGLADRYYDGGDYAMAEMFYRKVLEQDPENTDVMVDLATACYYNGRGEEAVSLFRKALEVDPQHKNAMFNMGVVMNAMGDAEGAIASWKRFLEVAGEDPHAEPIRRMIEELEGESEVQ